MPKRLEEKERKRAKAKQEWRKRWLKDLKENPERKYKIPFTARELKHLLAMAEGYLLREADEPQMGKDEGPVKLARKIIKAMGKDRGDGVHG